MKQFLPLLLCVGLLTHVAHRQLDDIVTPSEQVLKETLPSIEALRLLSLGYPNLAADYYWLRAIGEFGHPIMAEAKFPNVVALLTRALALDPYFLSAYVFAGTALTVQELDPKHSIKLLQKGMRYRPDDWRVPFLLGFNQYYFAGDYAAAAKNLAYAAQLPGAPGHTGPLATRLAASAGTPEVGLEFIDSILATLQDEELRNIYIERRKLLQIEVELRILKNSITEFVRRRGAPPVHMTELIEAGLVRNTPIDPFGEPYFIDPQGQAQTRTERLAVHAGRPPKVLHGIPAPQPAPGDSKP